jgi:hypothetical protein
MRALPITALVAALLGTPVPAPCDRALAQEAAPAGHQYVVSVSGMT